jgi:hypothetical protein
MDLELIRVDNAGAELAALVLSMTIADQDEVLRCSSRSH